ncbi:MAG: NUDIX domain-containing protein [Mariprofundus sp.]|nr:NUDIX domain-containing protein [Mariprofundus sp.]
MDYRIISKKRVYQGFFGMDEYILEHDCFAGGSLKVHRENMERGDAAAILLYDPGCDEVLLLEQFRIGPAVRSDNPWLIEIVAGMIDAGESAEQAAIREAREEAGYAPCDVKFLGHYYTTPGACSERIDLFIGLVNKNSPIGAGGGCAEEHEDIRSFWVPRQTAMQMVEDGKIGSGAPMLAILLAFGCRGVASFNQSVSKRTSEGAATL